MGSPWKTNDKISEAIAEVLLTHLQFFHKRASWPLLQEHLSLRHCILENLIYKTSGQGKGLIANHDIHSPAQLSLFCRQCNARSQIFLSVQQQKQARSYVYLRIHNHE